MYYMFSIRFAPHLRRGQSGYIFHNVLLINYLIKVNPLNEFVEGWKSCDSAACGK